MVAFPLFLLVLSLSPEFLCARCCQTRAYPVSRGAERRQVCCSAPCRASVSSRLRSEEKCFSGARATGAGSCSMGFLSEDTGASEGAPDLPAERTRARAQEGSAADSRAGELNGTVGPASSLKVEGSCRLSLWCGLSQQPRRGLGPPSDRETWGTGAVWPSWLRGPGPATLHVSGSTQKALVPFRRVSHSVPLPPRVSGLCGLSLWAVRGVRA